MGNMRICVGKGGFFILLLIYDFGVEVVEVSFNYNGILISVLWVGFWGILSRNVYDVCIFFLFC